MSKFSFDELVDPSCIFSCKFNGDVTDNDIGKPVKLVAADTYGLCSDGDEIEGFINGLETATADGKKFGSVCTGLRKRVELDGAAAVGTYVVSAANAAAGTKNTNGLPIVKDADVGTNGQPVFGWRVISGTGLDGDTTAIIERV